MKLPIYPVVIVAVVIVVGSVAVGRNFIGAHSSTVQRSEDFYSYDQVDHEIASAELASNVTVEENINSAETVTTSAISVSASESTKALASEYTMTQVTQHASTDSCWTVIDGSVYDLTPWIKEHPGGKSAILRICGKDGTDNYNSQHGGQASAERRLSSFKIGALIK